MEVSFLKKTILTALLGAAGTSVALTATFLATKSENQKIEPTFLFNESLQKDPVKKEKEITQVKKQKELDDFKEIAKSNMSGRLKVFWDKNNETKVKFLWYEEILVDSVPKNVKNLKITHDALVVELEEVVDYSATRRFDHSVEMLKNNAPITFEGGNIFEEKNCSVVWILSSKGEKDDWKVNCSLKNN